MSNYQISLVLHAFMFFTDCLFTGLKIFVPVVFLLKVFHISSSRFNINALVLAMNLVLLTAGVLFLTTFIVDTVMSLTADYEFGMSLILGFISGPHWFQFAIPFLIYAILPNVLWSGKNRSTIYSTMIIESIWYGSYFLVDFLNNRDGTIMPAQNIDVQIPIAAYAEKALIFIASISLVYLFISKRKHSR